MVHAIVGLHPSRKKVGYGTDSQDRMDRKVSSAEEG